MLSLAGRIVSRSKPMIRVSSAKIYLPMQKIPSKSLGDLFILNSHNANVGVRFMSSRTPAPTSPYGNTSSDNLASDSSFEGSTLDPGPTLPDKAFEFSLDEAVPSQDVIAAAAPTLQELGLGSSFTPVGILQNALDGLHSAGLPWWGAIVVTTLVLRTATFPLLLHAQKSQPEYMAVMSKIQERNELMLKLKQKEDPAIRKRLLEGQEEMEDIKRNSLRLMANSMLPIFVQMPIFISFFLALSRMAAAPVESMKTGGALWFTDLTVMDPYYLLPAMTCATLSVMIQIGADSTVPADQMPMRNFVRVMPLIMMPFIMNYEAAVLCFWSTSNFVSLVQTFFLQRPDVRKKLNLPPLSAMRAVHSMSSFKGFGGSKK